MREAAAFIAEQHSLRGGFLTSLFDAAFRTYRSWKNRREIVHLSELDDHVLRDIGLTHGDVDAALSQPLAYDPSAELQRIALRNRARWR